MEDGYDAHPSGERGLRAQDDVPRRRVRELVNRGAQLLRSRRPGEAIALLEEAYALDPEDVTVAINLGGAYILQERFAEAIPILEAASERDPDNAMVWTNLAAAYLGRLDRATPEMQERAIAAFERALQADPEAPHVNYNLGLIYRARGDLERACAHFWRALEVDPGDRDARHWLDRLQRIGGEAGEPSPPRDRSSP